VKNGPRTRSIRRILAIVLGQKGRGWFHETISPWVGGTEKSVRSYSHNCLIFCPLISFRNYNMSTGAEFTNINPVIGQKVRGGSTGSAKSRGSRIEEAGFHFSKASAVFNLESEDKKKGESTVVSFYATCVIITTTVQGPCCGLPTSVTTTIPKFRIKDVVIHEKPLLCKDMQCEAMYGSCFPCRPAFCSRQQKTICFILRDSQKGKLFSAASTVEVQVKNDIDEALILHYVYGPLLNSGDKTHALAHMVEEVSYSFYY
jgi:hypothetical protein